MQYTLRQLLDEGDKRLRAAGIENPRLAAEVILRKILGLRKIDLYLEPRQEISSQQTTEYYSHIERKLAREPLQYIVGETEWFGMIIKCDRRALIPRPETEIIVERALEGLAAVKNPRVADIGTGTGCIAIAVVHSRPDAALFATDVSADALELAKENISLHRLADKINLQQGNLLEPLMTLEKFDLIIANLPYVRDFEYPTLMPEVRAHEPQGALVAGSDGLDFIRPLIEKAPRILSSQGILVLEHGADQFSAVTAIGKKTGSYSSIEKIADYNHLDRGAILIKTS